MKRTSMGEGEGVDRRWLKRFAAGAVAFVAAAYFAGSSGWFVRGVILPSVGDAMGAELTATDVSFSPFTSIKAKGVRLAPKAGDTLLEVGGIEARYGLFSILLGNIRVNDVVLEAPVVTVVSRRGKDSNLDQVLRATQGTAKGGGGSKPPRLDLGKVTVKDGVFRVEREDSSGRRVRVGVAGLNLSLDGLHSGEIGQLKLGAAMEMESGAGEGAGKVSGRLDGEVSLRLSRDLAVEDVGCAIRMELSDASGVLQQYKGLGAALDLGLGPRSLTNATLRFMRGKVSAGEFRVKGQVNFDDREHRLSYELKGVDRGVLGLLAAATGLDVGDAVLAASGRLDVLNQGTQVVMEGRTSATGVSIGTRRGRTKATDISLQHRLTINQQTRSFICEQLDLGLSRGGRALVAGSLENGMNISWDATATGFRDSTYTIKGAGLDLQDWAALFPVDSMGGVADVEAKITAENAGRTCTWSVSAVVKDGVFGAGGRLYRGLDVKAGASGRFRDFNQINADNIDVNARANGSLLAIISGMGDWRLSDSLGGLQLDIEAPLAALLAMNPVEGVSLREGVFKAVVSGGIRPTGPVADMTLYFNDVTGRVMGLALDDYDASLSVGVLQSGTAIEVRKLTVTGQTGTASGGSVEGMGRFDPEKQTGVIDVRLIGVNQSLLGPIIGPSMLPNKVRSITIHAAAKAEVNLRGKSAMSGTVRVSDLVVVHPQGRIPEVPLGFGMDLDLSHSGDTADLRRLSFSLDPTPRATNRIEVSGVLHLGTNSPAASRLAIKSTALDLTPLYDLLSSATNAVRPSPPSPEPPAVRLPIRELLADLDIPRIHLRDIDVARLAGRIALKDSVVTLGDLGLRLNDSRLEGSARLDLGRPGYLYEMKFGGEPLLIEPILSSLIPRMKGLSRGHCAVAADIRGAGTTGASLKKSLAGYLDLRITNAEIQLPEKAITVPPLLSRYIPILPERLDPGAVFAAVGRPEMIAEPIRVLEARADMGNGAVKLTQARAMSEAIGVQVGGEVRIADELGESVLDLPVGLAIRVDNALPALRTVGKAVGTLDKPSFKPDVLGMGAVLGSLKIPGAGSLGGRAEDLLKSAGGNLRQATGGALGRAGAAVEAILGGKAGPKTTPPNPPTQRTTEESQGGQGKK